MIPLMMQQDYKPQGWRKLQYCHQDLGLFCNIIVILLTRGRSLQWVSS